MKRFHYHPVLKSRYSSWAELEAEIGKLPSTADKGKAFEHFAYAYFTIRAVQYQVAEIYMSRDIPESYRTKYRLGNDRHHDSGVDGLIIRTDGKSYAYQCKFRSGRERPSYEELTKFWSDSRYCDYRCTVANAYSVSDLSDKHSGNMQILVDELDSLDDAFFNELHNLVNEIEAPKVYHSPYEYQEKIIRDTVEGFGIEDRGKVIAACGTGKTLTALWIVERMKECEKVLFLAPSIALVKQTLEAWSDQAKEPFGYLCVCSDNTVSENVGDDSFDVSASRLGVPVTTDEDEIAAFLDAPSGGRRYIFSTYQSVDKIANAHGRCLSHCFDLIICDEAHRTAGMRSQYSLALEDRFVRSKKRLFMTATERMVMPLLLRRAEDNGQVVFSMDDEDVYGPVFSRYDFGSAIKDRTISDYRIVVAGVKSSDVYEYVANNTCLSMKDMDDRERQSTAESLYMKILLAKAMNEYSLKKVISFHSRIAGAWEFVAENCQNEISLRSILREFYPAVNDGDLFLGHISGEINAGRRARLLSDFKESEYSVLSNAKCLTEGVDVPIIDSVYFVDRKKSLVDIVQACGRALRTKRGVDKTAYFIIPILIPETGVASDVLYSEDFEIVYNIIQALRDQDARLAEWINAMNRKHVGGGRLSDDIDDGPVMIDVEGIDIQQFSEELCLKIATINASPSELRYRQTDYGKGDRRAGQNRIFKTIGDYGYDSYMGNLVVPTMEIYREAGRRSLAKDAISLNHNNISHTKKLGLIEKQGRNYVLTPLGEEYLKGEISDRELFIRQMMRYSCSVEDNSLDRILFPYRGTLEILVRLGGEKSVSFYEFAFCIYPMYDSSNESVDRAVDDIGYLREACPNLQAVNMANRNALLDELNAHFGTTLTETDIWGTKPTTVRNQFIYFRGHLALLDEIVEVSEGRIMMKADGVQAAKDLLAKDKSMESLGRNHLLVRYTGRL